MFILIIRSEIPLGSSLTCCARVLQGRVMAAEAEAAVVKAALARMAAEGAGGRRVRSRGGGGAIVMAELP